MDSPGNDPEWRSIESETFRFYGQLMFLFHRGISSGFLFVLFENLVSVVHIAGNNA
jgi:hypothetical protein